MGMVLVSDLVLLKGGVYSGLLCSTRLNISEWRFTRLAKDLAPRKLACGLKV